MRNDTDDRINIQGPYTSNVWDHKYILCIQETEENMNVRKDTEVIEDSN